MSVSMQCMLLCVRAGGRVGAYDGRAAGQAQMQAGNADNRRRRLQGSAAQKGKSARLVGTRDRHTHARMQAGNRATGEYALHRTAPPACARTHARLHHGPVVPRRDATWCGTWHGWTTCPSAPPSQSPQLKHRPSALLLNTSGTCRQRTLADERRCATGRRSVARVAMAIFASWPLGRFRRRPMPPAKRNSHPTHRP